jgi:hypothetical protein
MSPSAYILNQPVTVQRPSRWDIQARCAIHWPGESLTLPAGTWLLALPDPADAGTESGRSGPQSYPPHYRLADGRIVSLESPLIPIQAQPLIASQPVAALTAYRTLEQAMYEDWGLSLDTISHNPPFRLIKCPLCGGSEFTSLAFAEVWCDACNVQFNVRHTAGDPGFVVDIINWEHVCYRRSRYIVPRCRDLVLTMVYKSGGDPFSQRFNSDDWHNADCRPDRLALTDDTDLTLRPGLHTCELGDVYDWSFYGHAPVRFDYHRCGSYELVGLDGKTEYWPQTAVVAISNLSRAERLDVENAARMLAANAPEGGYRDGLIETLQTIAKRPSTPPFLAHRSQWPPLRELADNEQYLLYGWQLEPAENSERMVASPVWVVVTDIAPDKYSHKWQVVGVVEVPQQPR